MPFISHLKYYLVQKLNLMIVKADNNIKVVCRLRALNALEMSEGGQSCVEFDETLVSVFLQSQEKFDFTFDRIFGPNCKQKDVYEEVAEPILESVVNGYNGTIFAYGQTASGKTYTMEGPDNYDENTRGLIPRVMHGIFDYVTKIEEEGTIYTVVKVSFLEIYNEKINDLLDNNKSNLSIKEDKIRGVYVQNLTEMLVTSAEEMQQVMSTGSHNRTIAATRMNERSSRSHSLFAIHLIIKNIKTDSSQYSKLYFVDLAGSEKISKTQVSGQQLEEAKNINKSLTCLGMVINALTSDKKEHVPYRDSKLTRILSESLGGNSKTTLVVACSMCTYNDKETLGTLRFGARAKAIKNKPKINQQKSCKELQVLLDIAEKKIQEQESVIAQLTEQLEQPQKSFIAQDIQQQEPKEIRVETSKNAKNTSLKLLQQYMQIVNLTEECDKLRTEVDSKELMLQSRTDEMADKCHKMKQAHDALREQQQHQLEQYQNLLLENENLKHQISENDIKYSDFKRCLDQTRIDLKYLTNSMQLRMVYHMFQQQSGSNFISDTESTKSIFMTEQYERDQEEKMLATLLKFGENIQIMQNLALRYEPLQKTHDESQDDLRDRQKKEKESENKKKLYNILEGGDLSIIALKGEEQKMMGFLESHNTSTEYLDEDLKILIDEESSSSKIDLDDDHRKEESDIQRKHQAFEMLSDRIENSENLQIVQELFVKQRKQIHGLMDKNYQLGITNQQLDEKFSRILQLHNIKMQKLRKLYQTKKQELSQKNLDLHKQLEEITCEYSQFRSRQDSSLNLLQQQNRKLSQVLEQQNNVILPDYPSNNPLSREFQQECTIKQLMQERQEIYETMQKQRQESDRLRHQVQELQDKNFVMEKDLNALKIMNLDGSNQGGIFRRGPLRGHQIHKIRGLVEVRQVKEWFFNAISQDDDGQQQLATVDATLTSQNYGTKVGRGGCDSNQSLTFRRLKVLIKNNNTFSRKRLLKMRNQKEMEKSYQISVQAMVPGLSFNQKVAEAQSKIIRYSKVEKTSENSQDFPTSFLNQTQQLKETAPMMDQKEHKKNGSLQN